MRFKQKRFFSILIILLLSIHVSGQIEPVEDVDILAQHKKVLERQYPLIFNRLDIRNVVKISDRLSKIIFYDQNVYHETVVNSARKDLLIKASFKELKRDEFPDIVYDAYKEGKHGDCEVDRFFQVNSVSNNEFYAIDVKCNDEITRLYYSRLGGYVDPPY